MVSRTKLAFLLASVCLWSPGLVWAESVHFSGLYVPEGLTCADGQRISDEFGDLRAGYVIYDNEGRKSDDGTCIYDQVQALRDTALQILDLRCSYDGQEYEYRQLLSPLDSNRMLVINPSTESMSSFQVLTYCGWVPES